MPDYDLTYQEQAYLAEQYFCEQMSKIKIVDNHKNVLKFINNCYNPRGGECYHMSAHAIMGLEDEDKRICGIIDTFPENGCRQTKDYTHAWVEFKTADGGWYVYDPLLKHITPRELWYKVCKPRKIFSELTLRQILNKFVKTKYAHAIDKNTYVFRSIYAEKKEDYEPYKSEINNEKNGYLFNALSRGYLETYYHEPITVSSFIVRQR